MKEYSLTLFVVGQNARSLNAIRNVQALIERVLGDHCELDIVDLIERPAEGDRHKVLATPMLLKTKPAPEARIVGDLSDLDAVVAGLHLGIDSVGETSR